MARQSVSKHLAVLEAANLVTTVRRGREKLHGVEGDQATSALSLADDRNVNLACSGKDSEGATWTHRSDCWLPVVSYSDGLYDKPAP
jgi:hypothetical protein